jgi:predicted metalloprotease with PDZ domain
VLLAFPVSACAQQARISYRLYYPTPGSNQIEITLEFSPAISAPAAFVIPRNYPGGYGLVPYDSFVENPQALSPDGHALSVRKEIEGPRWDVGQTGESISRIEYRVDIARMERELHSAVDSSKVRPRYLGVLGYSVFGYIDGLEDEPIELRIAGPPDWPVLSTLSPASPKSGSTTAPANNYYALADSEVLMGPALQLHSFPGKIGLVMAVYAEGNVDVALEGELAREALDDVQAYFGTTPFEQYTVQLELVHPLPGHDYGFSQEHLDSGTFSSSLDRAIHQDSPEGVRLRTRFNFAHHMAHCWIPKRAYGVGYMPFNWEMPPVIDTIWFNEGFGRYAAISAVADAMPASEAAAFRKRQLAGLSEILVHAPRVIQEMSLLDLSREASFMYELDFRTGQNTFARGALMAAEIDDYIRKQTGGRKSLRDGLRYLVERTSKSQRPFETNDLPALIQAATGVDVKNVFDRWMKPNPQVRSSQ